MKQPKRKIEFSKIWLISCVVISIVFTSLSYVLAFMDKNTVSELSQSIIEILWGTSGIGFCGYCLQNSVRAFTSSRYGMPDRRKSEEIIIDESEGR